MTLLHELKRRVVTAPSDANARFALGEALYGDQKHNDAAVQLEKAIALDPTHANARRLLVRTYLAEGRMTPAERILADAVKLHPQEATWHDELAVVLIAIGRKDDALLQLEEAHQVQPGDPARLLAMARLHLYRRHPDRARPLLEEARAKKPHDEAIEDTYRETLMLLGDVTALETSPLDRGKDFLLGRTRQALDDPWLRTLAAGPLKSVAQHLNTLDAHGGRRALLGAQGVPPPVMDFLKAELLLLDGDREKAERCYQRCVDADASVVLAWKRLTELRQFRGDTREAVRAAERVLKLAPNDVENLERLGDLHSKGGNKDEARQMYQRAALLEPGGPASAKLGMVVMDHVSDEENRVGFIHALAWHETGGSSLPLEAAVIPGKGELIFSGNTQARVLATGGHIIEESMRLAFSCLKARAPTMGLEEAVKRMDLHIHFVDSTRAVEGGSAGLPLFLVAASAFLGRPLPANFAATGEITLHGAVRAIDGLHEKLVAASLAGIRTVMVPRRNVMMVRDLPRDVVEHLKLVYVDNITEALEHALPKRVAGAL